MLNMPTYVDQGIDVIHKTNQNLVDMEAMFEEKENSRAQAQVQKKETCLMSDFDNLLELERKKRVENPTPGSTLDVFEALMQSRKPEMTAMVGVSHSQNHMHFGTALRLLQKESSRLAGLIKTFHASCKGENKMLNMAAFIDLHYPPELKTISKLFNAMPCSQSDVERIFSKLRLYITDRRTRLDTSTVNKMFFLECNKKLLKTFDMRMV